MIGFHASHEQFDPKTLKELAQLAETSGFKAISCSDHFHPWTSTQGQSGFAWVYIAAVLEATNLPLTTVNAPGYRYHPAIIAQAVATLESMYPDRFILTVGSGENINEHITGQKWPNKDERNQRLLESVEIMKKLWKGETVIHRGLITVEEAKLYTLSEKNPKVFAAVMSPESAAWAASWADGMITISQPREKLQAIVDTFRKNGGKNKPMFLKVQLAYGGNEEKLVEETIEQWGPVCLPAGLTQDLKLPKDFESLTQLITPDFIKDQIRISTNLAQHLDWLQKDYEMGFERLYLHNVTTNQAEFITDFGKDVLPQLAINH